VVVQKRRRNFWSLIDPAFKVSQPLIGAESFGPNADGSTLVSVHAKYVERNRAMRASPKLGSRIDDIEFSDCHDWVRSSKRLCAYVEWMQ
jgi:hypothetical protein